METPDIMRGVQFWTDEIKNAGIYDQIPDFDDILTGKDRPTRDVKPILENIKLGDINVDIYHWEGAARIYLHIKN